MMLKLLRNFTFCAIVFVERIGITIKQTNILRNKRGVLDVKKEMLEKNLPPYLEHDLKAYKEGKNSNLWDCLISELIGSINSAAVDGDITEEQADYLFKEYVYREEE